MRSRAYRNTRAGRRRSPTPIPELDISFDHSRDYDSRTSIRSYQTRDNLNSYQYFKGKAFNPFLAHLYSFHLSDKKYGPNLTSFCNHVANIYFRRLQSKSDLRLSPQQKSQRQTKVKKQPLSCRQQKSWRSRRSRRR